MALYHLFTYYWINQDIVQARAVGQEYIDGYSSGTQAQSPWLAVVIDKLESIGT
jgi:hypothetical protein